MTQDERQRRIEEARRALQNASTGITPAAVTPVTSEPLQQGSGFPNPTQAGRPSQPQPATQSQGTQPAWQSLLDESTGATQPQHQQFQPLPQQTEHGFFGQITRGLRAGVDGVKSGYWGMQALRAEDERTREYFLQNLQDLRERQMQDGYLPRNMEFTEISDVSGAVDWFSGQIGALAPIMGSIMAGGVAGAKTGGAVGGIGGSFFGPAGTVVGAKAGGIVGSVIGSFSVGYGLYAGGMYGDLLEMGVEHDKAKETALIYGIPAAAVSIVVPAAASAAVTGALGREYVRSRARNIVLGAGLATTTEGLAEAIAEGFVIAGEEYATGIEMDPIERRNRLINAGAAGALMGTMTGSIGGLGLTQHTIEDHLDSISLALEKVEKQSYHPEMIQALLNNIDQFPGTAQERAEYRRYLENKKANPPTSNRQVGREVRNLEAMATKIHKQDSETNQLRYMNLFMKYHSEGLTYAELTEMTLLAYNDASVLKLSKELSEQQGQGDGNTGDGPTPPATPPGPGNPPAQPSPGNPQTPAPPATGSEGTPATPQQVNKQDVQPGDTATFEDGPDVFTGNVTSVENGYAKITLPDGTEKTVHFDDLTTVTRPAQPTGEDGQQPTGDSQGQPVIPQRFEATVGTGKTAASISFTPAPNAGEGVMRSEQRFETATEASKQVTKLNDKYPGLVFEVKDYRDPNDPFSPSEIGIEARIKTAEDTTATTPTPTPTTTTTSKPKGKQDGKQSEGTKPGQEGKTSDPQGSKPGENKGEGQGETGSTPKGGIQVEYTQHEKRIRETLGEAAETATVADILEALPDVPETSVKRFVREAESNRKRKAREAEIEEERQKRMQNKGSVGSRKVKHSGEEVTVKWSDKDKDTKKGKYGLIELDSLIPSHYADGSVNAEYSIKNTQPRDRTKEASVTKVQQTSSKLDPEQLGASPLAFMGAPTALPDGQVIQGHGRAAAVIEAKARYPEKYAAYKKWLADNATKFGLTREQVEGMKNPVLIREFDVDIAEAIRLGNVQNTAELRTPAIDQAKAAVRNMPQNKIRKIADIISSSKADSLDGIVADVGHKIFAELTDIDRSGYVEDGKITSQGYDFLKDLLVALVFDSSFNASSTTQFMRLPHMMKRGVEKGFGYIIKYINTDADIRGVVQAAVQIIDEIVQSNGLIESVESFITQMNIFEIEGAKKGQLTNSERFSIIEAALANAIFNAKSQKEIERIFASTARLIDGYADMFENIPAYGETKDGLQKAISEVLGIKPKEPSSVKGPESEGTVQRPPDGGDGTTANPQPATTKGNKPDGRTAAGTKKGDVKKPKRPKKASEVVTKPAEDTTKPPKPSKSDQYQVKGDKNAEEMLDLIKGFANIGKDRLSTGIDPQMIIQSAKIIAKGVQLGYNRFQQYLNFILENLGPNFLKQIFDNFKAAYVANAAMTGNQSNEDLNAISKLTADQAINNYNRETQGDQDGTGTTDNLESDSPQPGTKDGMGEENVSDGRGASGDGSGQGSGQIITDSKKQQGGDRIPDDLTAVTGASGNNDLFNDPRPAGSTSGTTGGTNSGGSSTDSKRGALDGGQRGERVGKPAQTGDAKSTSGLSLAEKVELQSQAEQTPVKLADRANIDETLPVLLPQQREDVFKAETRFAKKSTKENPTTGMLFTNGTGTGKTYTGLGIVKRFVKQGKNNILIIVPQQKKVTDWIGDATNLLLNVRALENTKDAGIDGEVIITTYANFRANEGLRKRNFDLVMYDESHKLMSAGSFERTAALKMHQYVANAPNGLFQKAADRLLGEIRGMVVGNKKPAVGYGDNYYVTWEYENDPMIEGKGKGLKRHVLYHMSNGKYSQIYDSHGRPVQALSEQTALEKAYEHAALRRNKEIKDRKKEIHEIADQLYDSTKVVFLSATPFSYHPNLVYADGYLFQIEQGKNKDDEIGGYNTGSALERFYMQHFGYRMRYNRLTQPEPEVNTTLMERNFHKKLEKEGAVSSRMLDLEQDYSRDFILMDSEFGEVVDKTLTILAMEYPVLYDYVIKRAFNYVRAAQFLESLKAEKSIDRIQQHLDMGRKVVLFHTYRTQEPIDIFRIIRKLSEEDVAVAAVTSSMTVDLVEQAIGFVANHADLANTQVPPLQNPVDTILQAFGDRARAFNGSINNRAKNQNVSLFNSDNSGVDILVVNYDAGKEGISMHDRSGKHPRVLINLGLPVKPTDSIQAEGRIYRVGQRSDAIFEYPVFHLNFEHFIFATRIAERASTAENLAMGEKARSLKERYKQGYSYAQYTEVSGDQGKGGKEGDYIAGEITQYEEAKALYFAKQKRNAKTKAKEGEDYFATPEPIGFKIAEWLEPKPNDSLLEPSTGDGAIGRFYPEDTNNVFVEPSVPLAAMAQVNVAAGEVIRRKFEDYHVVNKFDGIGMNPPYGRNSKTAMEHLVKATKHLRDLGRVIAVVPDGPSMQKRMDAWLESKESKGFYVTAEIKLPRVTFERAGTSVSTKIVVIDKINNVDNLTSPLKPALKRDLSNITDINELFDSIETMDINAKPEYKSDSSEDAVKVPDSTKQEQTILQLEEGVHTRDGYPIWTIKMNEKLERQQFVDLRIAAPKFNGYYSKFNGKFTFKREADAKAFLQHINQNDLLNLGGQLEANAVNEDATSYGLNTDEIRFQLSDEDTAGTFGSEGMAAITRAEIVEDARGSKVNPKSQLDLFKQRPAKASDVLTQKTKDYIRTKEGRIYQNAIDKFEETGSLPVLGQQINSVQDLIALYSVIRNPFVEKFFMIAVNDNGDIVSQTGLTSNAVAHVKVNKKAAQEFLQRAKSNGATGFYLTHNHPSGSSKPSVADYNLTAHYALEAKISYGLDYKGHIVFNYKQVDLIGDSREYNKLLAKNIKKIQNSIAATGLLDITSSEFLQARRELAYQGISERATVDVNLKDFRKPDAYRVEAVFTRNLIEMMGPIFDQGAMHVAYLDTRLRITGYEALPLSTSRKQLEDHVTNNLMNFGAKHAIPLVGKTEGDSFSKALKDKKSAIYAIVNGKFDAQIMESVIHITPEKKGLQGTDFIWEDSKGETVHGKVFTIVRDRNNANFYKRSKAKYAEKYKTDSDVITAQSPEVRFQDRRFEPLTPENAAEELAYAPDALTIAERADLLQRVATARTRLIAKQIRERTKGWNNSDIVIAETLADVPAHLRMHVAARRRLPGGLYDPATGKSYVLAFAHKDADSAMRALLHEAVGHAGVRGLINSLAQGDQQAQQAEFNKLLDEIAAAYADDPRFLDIAQRYRADLSTDSGRRLAAEELIALLAESMENRTLLNKIGDFVKRLIRELGVNMKLSDRDIFNMLHDAKALAVNGKLSDKPAIFDQGRLLFMDLAHGSPVSFSKFDLRFLGGGTGVQMYGHGIYFTEPRLAENVAKYYGTVYDPIVEVSLNGKELDKFMDKTLGPLIQAHNPNIKHTAPLLYNDSNYKYLYENFDAVMPKVKADAQKELNTIDDKISQFSKPGFESALNLYVQRKARLEIIMQMQKADFEYAEEPSGNLYMAKYKGDTPREKLNFLDWFDTNPELHIKLIPKIVDFLKRYAAAREAKYGGPTDILLENINKAITAFQQDYISLVHDKRDAYGQVVDSDGNRVMNGGQIYKKLQQLMRKPSMVSAALYAMGIDGNQYSSTNAPALNYDKVGYNYVLFNVDDVEISEHIRFQDMGDQTETEAFQEWFGESKVVDREGKPLVVYHGSPDARFVNQDGTFRGIYERYGSDEDGLRNAFWFSKSKSVANTYADDRRAFDYQNAEPGIVAGYLKIENPLEIDAKGSVWREAQKRGKTNDIIEQARSAGHDGVIIRNVRDSYNTWEGGNQGPVTDTFTVFESNQIKSATDNVGTFDRNNPDIRYQDLKDQTTSSEFKQWFGDWEKPIEDVVGKKRELILELNGQTAMTDYILPNFGPDKKVTLPDGDISYTIKSRFGSIMGYVKDADMPGYDGPSETRGQVLMLRVDEKGKGYGKELMLDALYTMRMNDVKNVVFTVPSSEGKPFNQALEKAGYITKLRETGSGTTEYKIEDRVVQDVFARLKKAQEDNVSKVVTEQGKPLVVYKGLLEKNWETGEPIFTVDSSVGPWAGFFSNKKDVAQRFKDNFEYMLPNTKAKLISAYLNIKNPLVFDAKGRPARDFMFDNIVFEQPPRNKAAFEAMESGSHDAVIIKNTEDEGDIYVPRSPSQVKSATDNVGTFSPDNPDIRFQLNDYLEQESIPARPEYTELSPAEIPQQTQKAYKLMKYYKNSPNMLFPLFAKADGKATGYRKGKWYKAERNTPKIGGRPLADRPGIHAVDLPLFLQGKVNKKGETRVWVEVEMPAMDPKVQAESDNSPVLKNGMREGIKSRVIGTKEAYNFKTNENATGAGSWPIAGSMKIVRVLKDADVKSILEGNGAGQFVRESMTGDPDIRFMDMGEQTNTPEFKKWFGKSVMVDQHGDPLVVYHGTNSEFYEFKSNVGRAHDRGFYGDGFYFTFNREASWQGAAKAEAGYYGRRVMEAYLKVENPFDFSTLSTYKGQRIGYSGTESLVFLKNLAEQFPELADTIMLDKRGRYNVLDDSYPITQVPISVLPKLFEKYAKMVKTEKVYDNGRISHITGYVKSETISEKLDDGSTYTWESTDDLGRYSERSKPEELEAMIIVDAIEKYEGIEADLHPEGYMTRNPQITESIKAKGHDGIVQTPNGDEVVVFEPTQIKSATDNTGTFDAANPDIRYQIIGEGANLQNNIRRNLTVAKLLEKVRKKPSTIRLVTGWEKGVDGKWRYEVPDITFDEKAFEAIPETGVFNFTKQDTPITAVVNPNDPIFNLYPQLKDIKVIRQKGLFDMGSLQGFYDSENNVINITPYAQDKRSTFIHEVQHAIQKIEGFALGGNMQSVLGALPESLLKDYAQNAKDRLTADLSNKADQIADLEITIDTFRRDQMLADEAEHLILQMKTLHKERNEIYERLKNKNPNSNPFMTDEMRNGITLKVNKAEKELDTFFKDNRLNPHYQLLKPSIMFRYIDQMSTGNNMNESLFDRLNADIEYHRTKIQFIQAELSKLATAQTKEQLIEAIKAYVPEKEAFKHYQSLAGEVEARNVQGRAKLDDQDRKGKTLQSTEDVAREDQIILGINESSNNIRFQLSGDVTESPAFKQWFGKSKATDKKGRPQVFYHGTNKSQDGSAFTVFDTYGSNYGLMGAGTYFTDNPELASSYTDKGTGSSPSVYPVFLSIQNPLNMNAAADVAAWENAVEDIADYHEGGTTNESWFRAAEQAMADQGYTQAEGADTIQEAIRSMGYDGITHIGGGRIKKGGVRHRVMIAFDPEQIKSATGNSGTFDANNPDIRFSLTEDSDYSIADLADQRRVPGGIGRIARLKGFFIEPLYWLEQKRDLKPLADKVRSHFDKWAQRRGLMYGKMHKEVLKPLGELKRRERDAVLEQFETYMRMRETGDATGAEAMRPTLHEIAEAMIAYSEFIGTYAGSLNQAMGVQVLDPAKGSWRPIGRLKTFFPRKLNRLTEATMRNPQNFPEHWNALIEALIDEGFVDTRAEADKFLKTYVQNYAEFNYFAGIEKARSQSLPSIAYDYGFNVLADYMDRWAERISQIEHFGQVTTSDTRDAFDQMISEVADENTRRFIRELQNRVYNHSAKDGYQLATSFLSRLATGLQLGNFGTATLNLFGGTTLNFMAFPLKANMKALGHLIKPTFNLDFTNKSVMQGLKDMIEFRSLADMIDEGRYRGAITNDMLNLLRDTNNIEGFIRTPEFLKALGVKSEALDTNQLLTKFVNLSLTYGGYTGTEMFIRSHAQLTSKYMLREALDNIAQNPTSKKSLKAIRMLQEHGFDYTRLMAERGDGGKYTERYIRYMSNLTQGSYKVDQVPIHLDTPLGRFFFKYVKFISQVSRLWYKDFFKPFVESIKGGSEVKVEVDGVMTTQRVKEFSRMLKFFAVAAIGGEIVRSLRNQLFGYMFAGPELDELEKALEDDNRWRFLSLLFERAFWNIQATGGLTIFGNYWQLTQSAFDRERARNPLEPPGYSIALNTGRFALDIYDQKNLSGRQLDNFIQQQFSMYRTTKRLAMNASPLIDENLWREAELFGAIKDRNHVRALIRRYEESEGIAGRNTRMGRVGKTTNSIMNERVHEALSIHEPGAALAAFLREAQKRPDDVVSISQSLNTSMRYRRPAGNRTQEDLSLFFDWLEQNVTESGVERVKRVHLEYEEAFNTLWSQVQAIRDQIRPINEELDRLRGLDNQTPAVTAEIERLEAQRNSILSTGNP